METQEEINAWLLSEISRLFSMKNLDHDCRRTLINQKVRYWDKDSMDLQNAMALQEASK